MDSYSRVFDSERGFYCGNCGRQRAEHCRGCSVCDAVGLLCKQCFSSEQLQHAAAQPALNQPDYVQDLLNN